jgi:hypothetical protein
MDNASGLHSDKLMLCGEELLGLLVDATIRCTIYFSIKLHPFEWAKTVISLTCLISEPTKNPSCYIITI